MPTRIGTASQVDASAGNGSTSVTVPAGANGVVAFWAHFDGNTLTTLSSLTLNGVAFTIEHQDSEGGLGTDFNGQGVARLVNPATGSQTLAWTWSAGGARTEGGEIILVYVQDANTSTPVGDADTISATGGDPVSRTLATNTTDLLLAFGESFSTTVPALDGTVFINDAVVNSHKYDVSEVTPAAGTTTINMSGFEYSSMAAIALLQAVSGRAGPPGDVGAFIATLGED